MRVLTFQTIIVSQYKETTIARIGYQIVFVECLKLLVDRFETIFFTETNH